MAAVVSTSVVLNPNPAFFLRHQPSASPSLLRLRPRRRSQAGLLVSSSMAPPLPSFSLLSDSTRTLSSLLDLALSASRIVLSSARRLAERAAAAAAPSAEDLAELRSLRGSLAWAAGPFFFAARRVERPSGYLNTPLTVVASGMAKWLDIYSGVLMVRVLLSWFPNIPWDRQPLSAIRDLCDPYLNLFRNIIPPVFDTLDVSPLLAFAVLGTLGSILNNSRGMY
ncbi:YGGT family [Musa troglodytarum]|uniref:YGGT family n=1 Tax=Musa troglodytarum TaxID=320322 RepID=A0A9E7HRD1_9LILI|nr:YGGT family [Musa troglodytarum]